MKVALERAPWHGHHPGPLISEAVEIIGDGTWREAATEFYAERATRLRHGKQAPKGIQPFLNAVLRRRFESREWDTHRGRFLKDDTWVRVTFRHQMSLGSDFLDALKVTKREGAEHVAILAASRAFLGLISPNDADVLVSYEKLSLQTADLAGCMDIPLFIGRLEPKSTLPDEVAKAISGRRPRDRYVTS
jgi:hypothetical protein